LGLVKPDGRDGLVRMPGGKAANWSCGGMMWTDECRRHVDRVDPVKIGVGVNVHSFTTFTIRQHAQNKLKCVKGEGESELSVQKGLGKCIVTIAIVVCGAVD
jgi:hypothetical protein